MTAHGCIVLPPRELDAFLAQALSPHLSTECNASNLGEIKLKRVHTRAVQLAFIFISGGQAAIFANDACAVGINLPITEVLDKQLRVKISDNNNFE